MSYTENLKTFIKSEEGLRLNTYPDPNNADNLAARGKYVNGPWYAIGYGYNLGARNENKPGTTISLPGGAPAVQVRGPAGKDTTITQAQADKLLEKALLEYENTAKRQWSQVNAFAGKKSWEALPENTRIALTSYAYNTGGITSLTNRSDFRDAILTDNYVSAGAILRDYGIRTTNAGVDAALIRRRTKEGAYMAGVPVSSFTGTTTPVNVQQSDADYFKQVYLNPASASVQIVYNALLNKQVVAQPGIQSKPGLLPYSPPSARPQSIPVQQYLEESGLTLDSQLNGELILLRLATEANTKLQAEARSALSRVDGLIPAEAAFLVQNNLFELSPDTMRQQMSANAQGVNPRIPPNYSHAWRSPGKLAITADLTIPGISGFRTGQIFWVGRTYEHYKQYGAFQLFGLTETITIDKGWTTTIHSRFNAMPKSKIINLGPSN